MQSYYQIMNRFHNFKDLFIKKKNIFEKKVIYPMDFWHAMMIAFFIPFLISSGVRIYYNGFIPVFTTLAFEISWFGFGWGKTPIIIRLATFIICMFLGQISVLYIINVKRREHNVPSHSFMELNQLIYSDCKEYINQKFYGKNPSNQDEKTHKD